MKRSIIFWLYFIIAILFGIYLTTRIVMIHGGHGGISVIHNISISTNTHNDDLTAVKTVAGAFLGMPTNSLDLDTLNNLVLSVPIVRKSATRRMPNGTLRIHVELYHTIAQWTDGIMFYPLSADGTPVEIPSDTRDSDAIVFRGTLPSDISDIATVAKPLGHDIDYLEWIENRRWNIITTNGITVLLPERNPESSLRQLISLDEKQGLLKRDIKTIDMRDSKRVLVK